ncbi:MAG: DUF4349 domain-containing protein [Lachnospiraceae bacterium]|nr:DUF4349 domain-containing protein [Lachnospiraceae bacterium]
MKAERFRESLDHINNKYIEEAATYGTAYAQAGIQGTDTPAAAKATSSKPFRAMKVWRAVAIAACALLAVGVGITAIGLTAGNKGSYSGAANAPINGGAYYEDKYDGGSYDSFDGGAGLYSTQDEAYTEDIAMPEDAGGDAATGSGILGASNSTDSKAGGITSMLPQNENAKIIYSAYLDVDTTAFDDAHAQIESITKAHSGYFDNLDQDSYSTYRNAYYVIRVPADEFDTFMSEIQGVGTVTSISQNASDITESYVDIESRLETAKTKLARLQELLSQAQNMSDIITIENEIADVQWEIDDLSGALKSYDSQVEYSTVTLNLHEVYRIIDGDSPLTFGERIKSAFSNGLKTFTSSMEDLLVFFAANWLWILLVAVVIAAVIIILVKFSKKDKTPKNRS